MAQEDMTLEQKELLEPFGNLFAQMGRMVRSMTDEDLHKALEGAYRASWTNCWVCTFDAAQAIQKHLRIEIEHRRRMAAEVA